MKTRDRDSLQIMESIEIRRSPLRVIRNLIILELGATLAYFIAAVLANYGELYQSLTFSQTISYEIAKFLFIFFSEGVFIIIIFLGWFFETYTIFRDMIIHERGIIWKRKRTIISGRPQDVVSYHGPLGRIFRFGTLVIKTKKETVTLNFMHEPETLKRRILELRGSAGPDIAFEELLAKREKESLEFKSSFRWDLKNRAVNKGLEKAAMKTIAAFLNSEGGYLLIGMSDQGEILGMESDYETLPKRNADGFENHFTNVFRDVIGPEYRQFVRLSFHTQNGKEVCMMRVLPSVRPAYLKLDNDEQFYIRTGNATTPLQLSEANAYIRSRWREE